MIAKLLKYSLFFIPTIAVISACAKIGAPTGGPKDYTPPKMTGSNPANFATNFHGKKIEITFNENIQLKDVNSNLIVSPPMLKKPVVLTRNKSIIITFEEPLKPFSTYRFAFGNSVQDLNEGNTLDNFEFVFSTCAIIDSLSLHGQVTNAFDHQPDKDGFLVMLYDKFEDSIPRKQLPVYVSKTSDKGWFSFNHIRPDTFMIVAVKDANMNYLFDIPTEQIAFSDTLIALDQQYHLQKDSIILDTVKVDSLKRVRKIPKPQILLYSFAENHKKQYLDKWERDKPNRFQLIFTLPIKDSLTLEPLNFKNHSWLLPDKPIVADTISYWITDTTIVHSDTLKLRVAYASTDSAENIIHKSDTIKLTNKKILVGKSSKHEAKKTQNAKDFKLNCSVEGKPTFDLNGQVFIEGNSPVITIDTSKIKVFKSDDAEKDIEKKKKPVTFKLQQDSIFVRRYHLYFPLDPNTSYSISVDTASVKNIYGEVNDSIGFSFKTQKDDFYGKIKLTLTNVKCPLIVQLLSDKDVIVKQQFIAKDQNVTFDYIIPAKYKIKVIYDCNNNKTWDTGNFEQKLQPEKVLYYNKILQVRSNWDMEESWKLE